MSTPDTVDAVIMWVDGSDPAFVASEKAALESERAKGKSITTATARHRDNGELRYALRGLIHNTPWIRRIHVVTNGQVPSWLRFDGEKMVHVKHVDIFPDADLLPCFNSFAIESCAHRIPGLSEVFLRLSDDFFIARPASRDEIMGERGLGRYVFKGKVQTETKSRYQAQIKANADLFQAVLGPRPMLNFGHAPQVRFKSTFNRFVETFAEAIASTRANRFRGPGDLIPLFLYPYFHVLSHAPEAFSGLLAGSKDKDFIIIQSAFSKWYKQVLVGNPETDWRSSFAWILKEPPLFMNLNDTFSAASRDQELAEMIAFLEALFPVPTPFESDQQAATE